MEARAPLKYERLDFYERYRGHFHGLEDDFLDFLMDIDFIFEILDEYGPIPWLRRAIIREIRKGARKLKKRCYNGQQRRIVKEIERYFCDEVERIYDSWRWRIKNALERALKGALKALKRVREALRRLEEDRRRACLETASDVADLVYFLLGFAPISHVRRAAIAGAAYRATYRALTLIDSLSRDMPIIVIVAGLALYYYLLFRGAVMA